MNYHINVGCGRTPTEGWKNYDNTPAIKLSNSPLICSLAKFLGLLTSKQIEYIEWMKKKKIKIEFSNAIKKIPLPDKSVKVLYSSHMFEHLAPDEAVKFLNEARRVLSDDGVIRIVIPDLEKAIATYNENKDADLFMEDIYVSEDSIVSVKDKIRFLVLGFRRHQWMYDGKSLVATLEKQRFSNVTIQSNGKTLIKEVGKLNLFEREEESVVVEAIK